MVSKKLKGQLSVNQKKSPTGIDGFDELTSGGLPKNRPAIIWGSSGSGKTVLSMGFLVNGAARYDEPGVYMSFEETTDDILSNMKSIHPDLQSLVEKKKIYIEYLDLDKAEFIEAGTYSLEGLFVRLEYAIKSIGAKRLVLDSLDALFFGLDGQNLQQEIRRLFKWLKDKDVTSVVTSIRTNDVVTKDSMEQFVLYCHRLTQKVNHAKCYITAQGQP